MAVSCDLAEEFCCYFRAVEDVEGRVLCFFPAVIFNMTAMQQGLKTFSHRHYGKFQIRTDLNLNRDEWNK